MLKILQNMDENISSFFDESTRYFGLQLELSEKAKEMIVKHCRFEVYKAGDTFFHQNQIAENLYFLVEAKLNLQEKLKIKILLLRLLLNVLCHSVYQD